MQLPSKIVDITMPLDTETVVDPEIMRPQIKYVNHQENAETMANFFDGMKPEDLPDGQAWVVARSPGRPCGWVPMDGLRQLGAGGLRRAAGWTAGWCQDAPTSQLHRQH